MNISVSPPATTFDNGPNKTLREWSSLIGIITAIIGNVLISFALNIQRYAHIRIDREYKYRHDKQAKDARKNLPKSLRGYGTAIQQEEAAEERARINASAEGPGHISEDEDFQHHQGPGATRRHSDDTLRPKENGDDEESGRESYLKSPWWWLGIAMMTIGETGNFLAYGFAPASIVSPLGVVALVSNCLIAPLMLKERFRQRDFWGVVVAIAGAVVVVLSASQNEEKLGPGDLWGDIKRWEFLTYILITAMAIVLLMFASPKYGRKTILLDLGLVGLFGGYTALSTKGVASLLSDSLYRAFTYPITYVLILVLISSAIMQIRYLNRALQSFDSTQVIPVQFVMFTLSVIIGSAVLYRDFEHTNSDHAIKFVVGCLLTFSGVYLITSGRKRDADEDDDFLHEETIHLVDEEVSLEDERTPLKHEQNLTVNNMDGALHTPRPSSKASSTVPSIEITPDPEPASAKSSTHDVDKSPWLSSIDHLEQFRNRPKTPQFSRIQSESSHTPFFTPETSSRQPPRFGRTPSSPANPQTPIHRGISPPKADASALTRSSKGSISRLLPGPLLGPLSSSLSAVAADSLLKGEGSPRSVRDSLRRNRSSQLYGTVRRRSVQPDDDVETGTPSGYLSSQISRQQTREIEEEDEGDEDGSSANETGTLKKTKGRLRSMSETLTGMMDRARGKAPDRDAAAGAGFDDDHENNKGSGSRNT